MSTAATLGKTPAHRYDPLGSLCRAPSYEYIGTGKHVGHWHSGQKHTRQLFIITVSSRTPATSRVLDTDGLFLQAPVIERAHALSLPGRLRRNDA